MGRTQQTATDFDLATLLNRAYPIDQTPRPTTKAARAAEVAENIKTGKSVINYQAKANQYAFNRQKTAKPSGTN